MSMETFYYVEIRESGSGRFLGSERFPVDTTEPSREDAVTETVAAIKEEDAVGRVFASEYLVTRNPNWVDIKPIRKYGV